jgi:hypothetical protein
MSDVENTLERRVKVMNSKEAGEIRHFHQGQLERCPRCGRLMFQPCLACLMEIDGKVFDPFDAEQDDPDILRIQLFGRERQRYEHFHLEKAAAANQNEEQSNL